MTTARRTKTKMADTSSCVASVALRPRLPAVREETTAGVRG